MLKLADSSNIDTSLKDKEFATEFSKVARAKISELRKSIAANHPDRQVRSKTSKSLDNTDVFQTGRERIGQFEEAKLFVKNFKYLNPQKENWERHKTTVDKFLEKAAKNLSILTDDCNSSINEETEPDYTFEETYDCFSSFHPTSISLDEGIKKFFPNATESKLRSLERTIRMGIDEIQPYWHPGIKSAREEAEFHLRGAGINPNFSFIKGISLKKLTKLIENTNKSIRCEYGGDLLIEVVRKFPKLTTQQQQDQLILLKYPNKIYEVANSKH